MKKRLFITYLVLLHLFLGLILAKTDFISRVERKFYPPTADTPELTAHFYRMLKYHKRMDGNVQNGTVVFIGDSISQGLCVSAVAPLSVNFGIGSDTTVGVLKRLPEYKSLKLAGVVVFAIGLCDMTRFDRSNESILKNYEAIIKALPEKLPIVFSALLPVDADGRIRLQGLNERIRLFNNKIEKLCAASPRLFFVNAGPLLADKDGNLSDAFYDSDGVHLNSKGNAIWISELRKIVFTTQSALKPIVNVTERTDENIGEPTCCYNANRAKSRNTVKLPK